jgi:hypothetical protein
MGIVLHYRRSTKNAFEKNSSKPLPPVPESLCGMMNSGKLGGTLNG